MKYGISKMQQKNKKHTKALFSIFLKNTKKQKIKIRTKSIDI